MRLSQRPAQIGRYSGEMMKYLPHSNPLEHGWRARLISSRTKIVGHWVYYTMHLSKQSAEVAQWFPGWGTGATVWLWRKCGLVKHQMPPRVVMRNLRSLRAHTTAR